jgi:hypothetical protein
MQAQLGLIVLFVKLARRNDGGMFAIRARRGESHLHMMRPRGLRNSLLVQAGLIQRWDSAETGCTKVNVAKAEAAISKFFASKRPKVRLLDFMVQSPFRLVRQYALNFGAISARFHAPRVLLHL